MRKTITRTMATSTINAFQLTMEGTTPKVVALEPIIVLGKATEKEALKAIKDKYGKHCSATIGSIEVHEDTYKISVEDFLKYATKVENGTEDDEEETEETTN